MASRFISDRVNSVRADARSGKVQTITLSELYTILHSIENRANHWRCFTPAEEWNGHMDYSEALRAAEFGWDNAPEIRSISLPEIRTAADSQTYNYNVTGEILDVGTYLTGAPECWLEPVSEPQPTRIIKLAIEIGGAQFITGAQMANRGQAIVALVNALELAGYSVELTVVRSFAKNYGFDTPCTFLIPIKHAGNALDMRRIQFMIGHPAFFRKCLFGLTEWAIDASIKTTRVATQVYKPEGYIHIPHNCGLADTLDESLEWASGFAAGLLEQIACESFAN
jgi:hypothetical protein